jgi:signal transduction histidine kinase
MNVRHWFHPPRHVLAVFVAVAVVSAVTLSWLIWLLLEQDKTVEIQRRQERLEQAADRAAAVMQGALSDLDRGSDPPQGVLTVSLGSQGMTVRPQGGLLYYPEQLRHPQDPSHVFDDGEQAEFARKDLRSAAEVYSRLALNSTDSIRAGALTRLARVRRRSGDYAAALRNYDELSKMADADVSGLPAELIAREGRASVFEETRRISDLRQEASRLEEKLRSGHWQLTKSEYQSRLNETKAWRGESTSVDDPDAIALAEATAWLWDNQDQLRPVARRLTKTSGRAALVVSRETPDGLIAAVAGPDYLESLCKEAVPDAALQCTLSDTEGRAVVGEGAPSRTVAIRTAAAAKLPWTLEVFSSGDSPTSSRRRPLLAWVAGILGLVWLTGAAFIVRAISREARVSRLQSDFVAAVSHEFRSPLSSLCQISEMLSADRFDSKDRRRHAYGVMARESERLRRLVESLLDFQRFETGAAVYHRESLEIGSFLKSVVADFQERLAGSGYSIELQAPESPTYVKADAEALSRALWNLLDNAVKYSPECRTVWVDAERDQHRVSVAVRDRGIGIPLREQREIFQKFVRGADSKARRIKGTGIGLAMVRHIVQAHGGEILLSSQPGEGSRFTIVFPEEAA